MSSSLYIQQLWYRNDRITADELHTDDIHELERCRLFISTYETFLCVLSKNETMWSILNVQQLTAVKYVKSSLFSFIVSSRQATLRRTEQHEVALKFCFEKTLWTRQIDRYGDLIVISRNSWYILFYVMCWLWMTSSCILIL